MIKFGVKKSYCERAYELMKHRRASAMALDDVARALDKEDTGGENRFGVENPAEKRRKKPASRFKSMRNTLHAQTSGAGWKKKLLRQKGVDGTQWLFVIDNKSSNSTNETGYVREGVSPHTAKALETAHNAGYSLDDVITAGLKALKAKIKETLTSGVENELKAFDTLDG